jgi:transcriptional regulator NrdR family protein
MKDNGVSKSEVSKPDFSSVLNEIARIVQTSEFSELFIYRGAYSLSLMSRLKALGKVCLLRYALVFDCYFENESL